ncbi:hypothetical protein TTHERM_000059523 (macronuclear) [Tetrahymena thermophila SB210]|uniref:Uncharacterized protein n=1 Tax=Tetrahymena thermophila (strain SB210) TaxID=312017 RepID=W7XAS9_TETTS|nr:hypothetical protein TTHERM_000059523 [Tetrahymena thermophila SB210]EWS76480.1 hypothetical protein TTHERM_000059523 [Tetrahymena thermophila SB210]|eukprot:XP_012650980.1 hypothetical protein TTHERM_000059523 [Tetrahymena thermophila SB210]
MNVFQVVTSLDTLLIKIAKVAYSAILTHALSVLTLKINAQNVFQVISFMNPQINVIQTAHKKHIRIYFLKNVYLVTKKHAQNVKEVENVLNVKIFQTKMIINAIKTVLMENINNYIYVFKIAKQVNIQIKFKIHVLIVQITVQSVFRKINALNVYLII